MHYLKFTSMVHCKKDKAIALNFAEIKMVRTDAKTPGEGFSHEVISYLIELLL